MKTSQFGINLIKKLEGLSYTPYICPAGIKTIGYGHVIKRLENFDKIAENQAEQILIDDLKITEQQVNHNIFIKLNQNQFDALISFTFNLGSGALQRSTLRQKINRGEIEEASDEFIKWVYANGKKIKGLIIRRNIEAALFKSIIN